MSEYRLYYKAYYDYLLKAGYDKPEQEFLLDDDLNLINWPIDLPRPNEDQIRPYIETGRWILNRAQKNALIRRQIVKLNQLDITENDLEDIDKNISGLGLSGNRVAFLFDGRLNYLV